jgi:nicotinamide phosphoribosyltransferase
MDDFNIINDTDSYKASHWLQYPPGTTSMFSYIESRGGLYDKTVFFGLQYYVKKYLTERITKSMVDEAKEFYALHGEPFNYDGWMHIVNAHGGRLPVRIRAVPEGTVVPTHLPLVTIESTDPKVFWLASWLETMLVRVWHPINVATTSYHIKQNIMSFLKNTADDPASEINFKLHDFGSRGVSSRESAAIGGAAHLVNFMGSDTVVGVMAANRYYGCKMSAFSIPAAEHSTITAWGKKHEVDAYRNMLRQYAKPNSLVACVSDSYDLFNAVNKLWGEELRQDVINSGATLIVRPDSGDPATIVRDTLFALESKFGVTINTKGYKVLNNVRVIQGDGINAEAINNILLLAQASGFSASNIAFGMGGGLLQHHNRDTQKFAMKCSSVTVNGVERDVFKDPITDHGKRSMPGRLDLEEEDREWNVIRLGTGHINSENSIMHTVFENGESLNETTLDEVRARAT